MELSLYLVRHGETAWALSGQHTSRTELPLTPRGEEEARALAERLAGREFDHVFVSPRLRARQTCALLGLESLALVEAELTEWDYGDFEGRRTVEIRADWPGWNLFRDGCPSGESPEQVHVRADRVLARLKPLQGDVLLISHGHFLRVLGVRWIGLPIERARHFPLGTASLSILSLADDTENTPTITRWNETAQTVA